MSDEESRDLAGGGTDPAGLGDNLVVSINGGTQAMAGNGVKGPDPAVWGEEQTQPAPAQLPQGVLVEGVKGPDPAQWHPDVLTERLGDDCKEIVDGGVEGEPQQASWADYESLNSAES